MKSRTWLSLAGLWLGLLLVSCDKKDAPAPVDSKPRTVAKVETPKDKKAEEAPPATPAEEDMPDEEEPSAPDTDPALLQPAPGPAK